MTTKLLRKFRQMAAVALSFALLISVVSPALAQEKTSNQVKENFAPYVPGQLIVKFKENQAPDNMFLAKYNLKAANKILKQNATNENIKKIGIDRMYLAEENNSPDLAKTIAELKSDPRVEYAEPNYIINIDNTPNDPSFSSLWGLNNTGQTGGTANADINAPEAWDIQTGSSDVVVGVIDTGVDYNHPDLAVNIWTNPGEIAGNGIDDDGNGYIDDVHGWNFTNSTNNVFDDNGHGTHVSGTIGAVGNNGVGVAGINWNVKIAALKFLGASGSGSTAGAIGAINYANTMGFKITNNSWGGGGFSQSLYDAIAAANAGGNLFVAAAGNSGINADSSPSYPASYDLPNIISVAATDSNDLLASFSNYGATSVDLGAPGVDIYSTTPNNTYSTYSGTSMASPHVTGVAGLVKAQFPTLDAAGIKSRILGGVDLIPSLSGKTVTGGRLNALNALETDTVPPAAISNLSVSSINYNSSALTWTAQGDDGAVGKASAYDIRYSTSPITDSNWNSANQVSGEPTPNTSGSRETFTVLGLSPNTAYYFAIKSIDNVRNISALSNIASGTTTTPAIVFQDNMESGSSGWTHGGTGDDWALGTPTSGPGSAYSGANAWATNLTGNYGINNMNAWLQSPSFSLSGFTGAELNFRHYYYTENYYDGGIVEISTNSGSSWTRISPIAGYPEDALYSGNPLGAVPAYSGSSGAGWQEARFDLSAYDGTTNVNLRFRFGTDSSVNNYPGWYIDNFTIFADSRTLPPPNNKPIANAGGPYSGIEDQITLLDGSLSSDADGDALTYKWDFGDNNGATGTIPQINHTYLKGGNYNVTFIVNDGLIDSDPSVTTVNIAEVNDAPIANAGPDQTGILGQSLSFNGSASTDEETPSASLAYLWNFGDGTTGSGQIATHAYSSIGTFTATLTVTDAGGLTAQDTALITINAADSVSISKATYSKSRKELIVEATSTQKPTAVLTVQGFGTMTYISSSGLYRYTKRPATNPGSVTVKSSLGGTAVKTVTVIR